MSEKGAADHAEKESRRHDKKEGTEKGTEQRLAPIDTSADLQNGTIAEQRLGDDEFAARILGNLQPGVLAIIVFVDRPVCRPDPVLRRHQEQKASLRPCDPDKKRALILIEIGPMNQIVQSRKSPGLVNRGALL